jgi:hypothetical protein
MTSLAQLDKFADRWFNNEMRRRGFAAEKKFIYWRKRGPLYDLFMPRILAGGGILRVHVTIWSPWVDSDDGTFTVFPPEELLIGGTLSDEFPEVMRGGVFDIKDEAEVEIALRAILQLIDLRVLPWFGQIKSVESYFPWVGDHGFYPTPDAEAQIRKGIALAFQKEPPLW